MIETIIICGLLIVFFINDYINSVIEKISTEKNNPKVNAALFLKFLKEQKND